MGSFLCPGTRSASRAVLAVACALGVVLPFNGGSTGQVHAQAAPTAAVLQELIGAVNRGDGPAAAALYSPNAVLIGDPDCFPRACLGTTAISQHFLSQADQHLQATLLTEFVDGAAVTGRLEARFDGLAGTDVERVVALYTLIVQDDQIVLFSTRPDPSDPQTARFLATQQPD